MARQPKYFLELNQADPDDSPTPGLSHYAGGRAFNSRRKARRYGRSHIGGQVPAEDFAPCCSWQKRETPVSSFLLTDYENREEV